MRAKTVRKLRQGLLAPYPDLREEQKDRLAVIQSDRDQAILDAQAAIDKARETYESRRRRIVKDIENKAENRRREELKRSKAA